MNLHHLPHFDTFEQVNSHVGPEDYGKGRQCSVCHHQLCRYNEGPACWHHGTVEDEEERPLLRVLEGGRSRGRVAA